MHFQQELTSILSAHSLPANSHATLALLESHLLTSLQTLLVRLKVLYRRIYGLQAVTAVNPPVPQYGTLCLLLHLHDAERFDRLTHFLQWEDRRRQARQARYFGGQQDLAPPVEEDDPEKEADDQLYSSATDGNGSLTPLGTESRLLDNNIVDILEEYIEPSERYTDGQDHLHPGIARRLAKLKKITETTDRMSAPDYVHYAEIRSQASFSGQKFRNKQFTAVITPYVLANNLPLSDQLSDLLAFLAYEITVDLIDRACEVARTRVTNMEKDAKAKLAAERVAKGKREAASKRKMQTQSRTDDDKIIDTASTAVKRQKSTGSTKSLSLTPSKQVKEKLAESDRLIAKQKIEAEDLMPSGPFSGPQTGGVSIMPMSAQLSCPATVSQAGFPPNPPTQAFPTALDMIDPGPVKLGTSRACADVVGSFAEVLTGDFDMALYDASRKGQLSCGPLTRPARVMHRFRR